MLQQKCLSEEEIGSLKAYRDLGLTQREIAKRLQRSQNAEGNVLRKGKNPGKAKHAG